MKKIICYDKTKLLDDSYVYKVAFALLDYIESLRREKKYELSDFIRNELIKCGFAIKISKEGYCDFDLIESEDSPFKKLKELLIAN